MITFRFHSPWCCFCCHLNYFYSQSWFQKGCTCKVWFFRLLLCDVTQSWLIAHNWFLSLLLCAKLDSLWLIFQLLAFCESKCCSVTIEICWTGDLCFWMAVRKTNRLIQKTKHFWEFLLWDMMMIYDLSPWKFLLRTKATRNSAGHRSGGSIHFLF